MIEAINSVFFCSVDYMTRRFAGANSGALSLFRGIVGLVVTPILLAVAIPRLTLLAVFDWPWWVFLIFFFLGVAFSHYLVYALLIITPLQMFGLIEPILNWLFNAMILIAVIVYFLLHSLVGYFRE